MISLSAVPPVPEKPERRACEVVAARLSAELYRRRMSYRQLAALAGVDDRTVRNLLDAKNTRLDTLEAVAVALGVPVIALVSDPAA